MSRLPRVAALSAPATRCSFFAGYLARAPVIEQWVSMALLLFLALFFGSTLPVTLAHIFAQGRTGSAQANRSGRRQHPTVL